MKKLLIVESVHKSKTIQGFLGPDWIVKASVGHIREMMDPKKIPEAKKEKYHPYSIETQNFDVLFEVSYDRKKVVADLKKTLSQVEEIYLGTDPDREGEFIAWHLQETLKTKLPTYRVTWQEVTKKAVEAGIKKRTKIDQLAVDAAMSRSIYDRLFGFSISGNVQKTIREKSAGRVQSPALRLIVNREKDRLAFVTAEYLSVTGNFSLGTKSVKLDAKLLSIGENRIAIGSSFDSEGKVKDKHQIITPDNVGKIEDFLNKCEYEVSDVSTKAYSRKPPAPYTTSSFQQDVGGRLRMSSKQMMSVAQKLFDQGFISYMRTDSPHLGDEALQAAFNEAKTLFGVAKTSGKPTIYKAKGQGGHEAIRPVCDTNGRFFSPKAIQGKLASIDPKAHKVYEAIYNRTVASQMNPAKGFTTTVKISSTNAPEAKTAVFSTSATTYTDLGWMSLTKPLEDEGNNNVISDSINKNDSADLNELTVNSHTTTPPSRFTEPQLVAKLEELEIGRPSTYASIVAVNQTRGYVHKKSGQLFPTWQGMKVAQYLEGKIPSFVSYEATAKMETELDKIEQGQLQKPAFLAGSWSAIQNDVLTLNDNVDWDDVNELSTIDLNNGYAVKSNSFGAFLEKLDAPLNEKGYRPGVKLADAENVLEMDFSNAEVCRELYESGQNRVEANELGELTSGPYEGWTVTARDGKYGAYAQAINGTNLDAKGKSKDKPINQTLPEDVDLATVTLEDIVSLFEEIKLPRNLSPNFFVGIGKRGPWIANKKSAKSRRAVFISMPEEFEPRTITLDEAEQTWDDKQKEKEEKPAKKPAAKKTSAKK